MLKHISIYFCGISITSTACVKNQDTILLIMIQIVSTLLSNLYTSCLDFYKRSWKRVVVVYGYLLHSAYFSLGYSPGLSSLKTSDAFTYYLTFLVICYLINRRWCYNYQQLHLVHNIYKNKFCDSSLIYIFIWVSLNTVLFQNSIFFNVISCIKLDTNISN